MRLSLSELVLYWRPCIKLNLLIFLFQVLLFPFFLFTFKGIVMQI